MQGGLIMILISVIIPFYKEIDLIDRAVKSVLAQKILDKGINIEIIIGNDGALSHSEIKSAIQMDPKIDLRIVDNNGPRGPGGARNAALSESKGVYCAFLDADDVWLEGKLAAQIALAKEGANFIATAYVMDDSKRIIKPPTSSNGQLDVFRSLGILTSSVMVLTSLVKERMFRDLRFSQDIDLWHRITNAREFCFASLNEPFVMYSKEGSTKNKFTQARSLWKVMTINNISLSRKLYCLVSYAYRGIKIHFLRI